MREALARHANIPAATSLIRSGVEFPNDSERVRDALAAFTRQMPNVPAQAYAFQGWRSRGQGCHTSSPGPASGRRQSCAPPSTKSAANRSQLFLFTCQTRRVR